MIMSIHDARQEEETTEVNMRAVLFGAGQTYGGAQNAANAIASDLDRSMRRLLWSDGAPSSVNQQLALQLRSQGSDLPVNRENQNQPTHFRTSTCMASEWYRYGTAMAHAGCRALL